MQSIGSTETVKITGVNFSNRGCPAGSANVVVSPDSQELSILFDEFTVTNGQAVCSLSIPIEVPAGYQFSLYGADYRGFVGANTSANLRVNYSFAGQNGSGFSQTFQNEADYNVQDNLVTLANIGAHSFFGQNSLPSQTVNLHINLALTATGDGAATLDSLDLAHQGNVYYPSPISSAQNNSPLELFDFRASTTDISATFSIYREAAYDNTIYLYAIQDETGAVLDPISQRILTPTDADYLPVALRNAVADISISTANYTTTTVAATLPQGRLLAPAIVIDSDRDAFFDTDVQNDPTVYTPFVLGNADKVDHILRLDDNTFVFEDLAGGGDLDYNDIILIATFQPIV